MLNYIIRRVLYMIPILFGIALVVFLLFNVVGGDPVLIMVGKHASPQMIAELRHELGLDRPIYVQFLDLDRKSTRLNSSHVKRSRMPSSA